MTMNRILIIASSLVFAISMASLSAKPSHIPAWPSGEQIAHGIMAIAVLVVSLVLIAISLVALFDSKSRNTGLICIALCLPMPVSTLRHEMSSSNRKADLIKSKANRGDHGWKIPGNNRCLYECQV
jgi:hypothetical protein